jgi:hypothetical protein
LLRAQRGGDGSEPNAPVEVVRERRNDADFRR